MDLEKCLEQIDARPDTACVLIRTLEYPKLSELKSWQEVMTKTFGRSVLVVFLRPDEAVEQLSVEEMALRGWIKAPLTG